MFNKVLGDVNIDVGFGLYLKNRFRIRVGSIIGDEWEVLKVTSGRDEVVGSVWYFGKRRVIFKG